MIIYLSSFLLRLFVSVREFQKVYMREFKGLGGMKEKDI